MGGIIAATILAVFLVPVFYYLIKRASEALLGGGKHAGSAAAGKVGNPAVSDPH